MLTTETASEKIATHNNNKFHQLFIRLRERIAKKEKTPSAVDVAIIGQRHQHSFIFSARSTSTERWYIFLRFLTTVKVTPLAFENLLHSKREKKSTDTPNYQRFSLSTTFYFLLFAFYPEPPPPTYNFLNCAFFSFLLLYLIFLLMRGPYKSVFFGRCASSASDGQANHLAQPMSAISSKKFRWLRGGCTANYLSAAFQIQAQKKNEDATAANRKTSYTRRKKRREKDEKTKREEKRLRKAILSYDLKTVD